MIPKPLGLFYTQCSFASSCLCHCLIPSDCTDLSLSVNQVLELQKAVSAIQFKESKNEIEPKKIPKIFEVGSVWKIKTGKC
jgi:hypothetical protein